MRCKHNIEFTNDHLPCFSCNRPARTYYRYSGDTRWHTRSRLASIMSDGLKHDGQWLPPSGSMLAEDYGRTHWMWINREGVLCEGPVETPTRWGAFTDWDTDPYQGEGVPAGFDKPPVSDTAGYTITHLPPAGRAQMEGAELLVNEHNQWVKLHGHDNVNANDLGWVR